MTFLFYSMLDIKFIRENPEAVKQDLAKKRVPESTISALLKLDEERRDLLQKVEALKAQRNQANDQITLAKREGKPVEPLISAMKSVSQNIADIDSKMGGLDINIQDLMITIPNIPDFSVPEGTSSASNKVVREWGKQSQFAFKPKDHIELAQKLGWISFERAVKLAGSGFSLFQGEGARLVRALMNFMLDLHTKKHGYQEIWPPILVNTKSMTGTGQLPKMEEDMYRLRDDELYLIPTAEVPVTNIHRDEILEGKNLPIKYAAYSPCFRREAGSYGKDTRGLSRVHQFDKVELVKFVKPENALNELELLLKDAEEVLQLLELPYRVLLLC